MRGKNGGCRVESEELMVYFLICPFDMQGCYGICVFFSMNILVLAFTFSDLVLCFAHKKLTCTNLGEGSCCFSISYYQTKVKSTFIFGLGWKSGNRNWLRFPINIGKA